MWHKVADGDLPTDSKEIRWIENTNNYYNGFYGSNDQQFHADVGCYFNEDESGCCELFSFIQCSREEMLFGNDRESLTHKTKFSRVLA